MSRNKHEDPEEMKRPEEAAQAPDTPEIPPAASEAPEVPPEAAEPPEKPEKAPEQSPEERARAAEDRYLRLAAEYENYRKRSARERDALYGDVRADTVVKFLPVYDNLQRAIAAMTQEDPGRKGVEMTLAQFETVLVKLGVTPIEALGKAFDPTLHNAVMHIEDPEQGENLIVEEFERGFRMGDKVIRFSMVKVAN